MNQIAPASNRLRGDHEKTVNALESALRAAIRRRGSDVKEDHHLRVVYRFDVSKDAMSELASIVPSRLLGQFHDLEHAADKTLALRRILAKVLENPEDAKLWSPLAKWIVQRWGRVDKNGEHDYERLVVSAESWQPSGTGSTDLEFKHIARWSKYLAFRFPKKAAIYDARVEYALNWYLRQERDAFRFRSVESQNSLVSFLDHGVLLAARWMGWDALESIVKEDVRRREAGEISKSQVAKQIAKLTLGPADTYSRYIEVLRSVAEKLYPSDQDWGLTKTEMLLFGLATTDVPLQVFQEMRSSAPEVASKAADHL